MPETEGDVTPATGAAVMVEYLNMDDVFIIYPDDYFCSTLRSLRSLQIRSVRLWLATAGGISGNAESDRL